MRGKYSKFLTSIIISILFFSTSAIPATYKCGAGLNPVEQIICDDKDLSELDNGLGIAYKEAKSRASTSNEVADIVATQRDWIRHRNTCGTRDCIQHMYEDRTRELLYSSKADVVGAVKTPARSENILSAKEAAREQAKKLFDRDVVAQTVGAQSKDYSVQAEMEYRSTRKDDYSQGASLSESKDNNRPVAYDNQHESNSAGATAQKHDSVEEPANKMAAGQNNINVSIANSEPKNDRSSLNDGKPGFFKFAWLAIYKIFNLIWNFIFDAFNFIWSAICDIFNYIWNLVYNILLIVAIFGMLVLALIGAALGGMGSQSGGGSSGRDGGGVTGGGIFGQREKRTISHAVQRGQYVYVYDQNHESFVTRSGELYGYSSSTFSIKRGGLVETYDQDGELRGTHRL